MDWYYPVLTSALTGAQAKARMADGWDRFVMEGLGVRCVDDEPWMTASETAECALAFACDRRSVDRHRPAPMRTLNRTPCATTGCVLDRHRHGGAGPQSCSRSTSTRSYTAAAVILAVDAITQTTQAANLFVG